MQINFQQGIISYPAPGGIQTFLIKAGVYVNLSTSNGQINVAFAQKDTNYLLTETATVTNAWGPIPVNTDCWLYWDINTLTAVRSFSFTLLQPTFGTAPPSSPQPDQHWFDTINKTMFVYVNGVWRAVIRVFAGKVNNNTFLPLGQPGSTPYAGSQVGLQNIPTFVGRIIYDGNGQPIRRMNGTFFTSEDDFYLNGSPANTIRFEANVQQALADATLAKYHVVSLTSFGHVNYANYNDLNETFIAMAVSDALPGDVLTVVSQGTIDNPDWAWTTPGAALWVLENGELTETDPHIIDPGLYTPSKPPIARVVTPTQIFFDQGLGGQGAPGVTPTIELASNSVIGITRLSVLPASLANPIAVGDNDPRNTNARTPTAHTHVTNDIITAPYSDLTGATLTLQLQQLADLRVKKAGDTMTGALTLFGAPTSPLHAATKQYVDDQTLANLNDVSLTSPTASQVLSYNGAVWTNSNFPFIPSTLTDLTDVTITLPGINQFLRYNGSQWINQTVFIPSTLDSLTDVTITAPVNNEVLTYVGGTWVNLPGGGGGGSAPDNQIVYGAGGGTTISSSSEWTYDPVTGALVLLPNIKAAPGNSSLTAAPAAEDVTPATAGYINYSFGIIP